MTAMIDVRDLQLAAEVARTRSFVAASRRTGVPTSTISRTVTRLEQHIGARLFERTSRVVRCTDLGRAVFERTSPLFAELREILENLPERDDEPAGVLRVTAPVVAGVERLGRALVAFARRYPRVEVDQHLGNQTVNLIDDGFDLAFRVGPLDVSSLVARQLWDIPYAFAASPGFVKEVFRAPPVGVDALERAPAVVARPALKWVLRGHKGKVFEIEPRGRFRANDLRVAIDAAKAGLGVVCAPLEMIQRERRALAVLDIAGAKAEGREMFAVYPSARLLSRRVRAAIDWVANFERSDPD